MPDGVDWPGADEFVSEWMEIYRVDSARGGWHQGECGRCSWQIAGAEPVVEDACHNHANQVHKQFGWPAPMLILGNDHETYRVAARGGIIPTDHLTAVAGDQNGIDNVVPLRHPAFADAGWMAAPMVMSRLRHLALGDMIDSLDVVGYEIRIQLRKKRD